LRLFFGVPNVRQVTAAETFFHYFKLLGALTMFWSVKLHAGETSLVRLQRGLKSEILFFYPIKKLNKIKVVGRRRHGRFGDKAQPCFNWSQSWDHGWFQR